MVLLRKSENCATKSPNVQRNCKSQAASEQFHGVFACMVNYRHTEPMQHALAVKSLERTQCARGDDTLQCVGAVFLHELQTSLPRSTM